MTSLFQLEAECQSHDKCGKIENIENNRVTRGVKGRGSIDIGEFDHYYHQYDFVNEFFNFG